MPLNQAVQDEERKRREREAAQAAQRQAMEQATQQQTVQKPTVQQPSVQQPQSAQQQLQYKQEPQQQNKWYQGSQPTFNESMARIYTISKTDYNRGKQLYDQLMGFASDPTSNFYNPYNSGTNQAIYQLHALGFDMSKGVTKDWIAKNAYLQQYYRTGSSGTPLAPTKTSTKEQNAAYWYYQILKAEDTTEKAELEWNALREEIAYWTARQDRNYSDDEILAKIDWNKYKTLTGLDADRANGTPTKLNRGIGYSQDNLRGVIWAARNGGGTGNAQMDAVKAILGEGKGYTRDESLHGSDDPTSPNYNPYGYASTMDEAAKYFNVYGFGEDWLEKNKGILTGNDETAKKYYQQIASAEKTTKKAEEEWKSLRKDIAYWASRLDRNYTDEEVLAHIDWGKYKTLANLDEDRKTGTPTALTRGIGYSQQGMQDTLDFVRSYGVGYQENEDIRSRLDATSDKYSPYSVGSTLDDAALYFSVAGFGPQWLEENRAILNSTDATQKAMYQKVYRAEQTTLAAEKELQELWDDVYNKLKYSNDADYILNGLLDGRNTLKRMDESMKSGDLLETTRAINYRWQDIEDYVRKACEKQQTEVQGPVYVQNVTDALNGVSTQGTQTTTQSGGAPVPQGDTGMVVSSAKDAAAKEAAPTFMNKGTAEEKLVAQWSWPVATPEYINTITDAIQNGTMTGTDVVRQAQYNADSYTAKNYLDILKGKGDYTKLQKEIDGLIKERDALQSSLNPETPVHQEATTEAEKALTEAMAGGAGENYGGQSYLDFFEKLKSGYQAWLNSDEDNPVLDGIYDNVSEETGRKLEDLIIGSLSGQRVGPDSISGIMTQIANEMGISYEQAPYAEAPTPNYDEMSEEQKRLTDLNYTIEKKQDELSKLQDAYDDALEKEKILNGNYDSVAKLAGINAADDSGLRNLTTVLDGLYEIGSEYVPTQWSSYSIYDANMRRENNPSTFQEQTVVAQADKAGISEALQNLDYALKLADRYGVELPDEYKRNLDRYKATLERAAKGADYFLMRGNEDFDSVASQAGKDIITAINQNPFSSNGYSYIDKCMADPFFDNDGQTYAYYMTDDERNTYLYIRAKEGADAAKEFYDYLTGEFGMMNNRLADVIEENAERLTKSGWLGFGLMNLARAAAAPVTLAGTIKTLVDTAAGKDINPRDAFFHANISREAISVASKEEIDKIQDPTWRSIVNIGYDVASSMADNAANMVVFGGLGSGIQNNVLSNFVSAIPMAAEAAGDTMRNAVINGASKEQMLALGLSSFLAESLTEAITVGNIKADFMGSTDEFVHSFSELAINALKDMGEEAFGEASSEIMESVMQNVIYRYMDGLSIEDVGEKDIKEILSDAVYAGFLGALSGGAFNVIGDFARGEFKNAAQIQYIARTSGQSTSQVSNDWNAKIAQMREAEANQTSAGEAPQGEVAGPMPQTGPMPQGEVAGPMPQGEVAGPMPQGEATGPKPDADLVSRKVAALNEAMGTEDVASKTTTVAAVLSDGNNDMMQSATMQAVSTHLADRIGADESVSLVRDIMMTASESGINQDALTKALTTAVLGNGGASSMLDVMVNEGVTKDTVGQMMMAAGMDSTNQTVQQNIQKAVEENQIATRTKEIYAETAGQLDNAKTEVSNAKADVQKATTDLEEQHRLFDAFKKKMDTIKDNLLKNAGNQNYYKALEGALGKLESQNTAVKQREQALEDANHRLQEAQGRLDGQENALLQQAREQAQQEVVARNEQYRQGQQEIAEQNALALAQEQAIQDEQSGLTEDNKAQEIARQAVAKSGLTGDAATALQDRIMKRYEQVKSGNVDTSQVVTSAEAGKVLGRMARKLGVEIRVEDMPVGRGKYENGVITLSNKLTIGQAMVEAALHEVTHSVENTKAYQNYHDFVLNTKYADPVTLQAAIDQKIAEYEKAGITLNEEGAKKELVAEFARTDLHNRDTVERLVDNGLGGTIRNALHNVNQFLKNMKLTGQERVDAENLRKAERMLQKAMNQRKMTDTHPAAAQFSIPQLAQSMGLYFDENTLQLYDRKGGNVVDTVTPEMLTNTPIGMLIDLAANGTTAANGALKFTPTISQETAQAQKKMFADLMSMCAKYKDSDLVWEIASSTLESTFSALKSNSDPQYKTTVDFGTVCAKTQEIINVLSKTMLEKSKRTGDGGLTREDIMKAYNETFKANLTVPCPVCYVFSRWMGVPSLLGQMQQYQKNYVVADENGNIDIAKTQEKADAYVKQALAKYGDAKKINSAKSKIQGKLKKAEDTRVELEQTIQLNSKEGGDAEKVADAKKKLDAVLKRMVSLDEQLGEVEAYNWVTQALCAQDENKQLIYDENGKVVIDPEFRLTPDDVLFDLNRTGEFAKYTKNWQYRNTRGAGMGKAILPYSGETIGDIIYGVHAGGRWAADQNPLLNLDPQRAANAIKNAIERARVQNLVGGQRLQSTSDFRPEWGLDYMMTFLEMQAIGSKAQMYTKVAEAVDFLASCGGDVNCSVMGKGQGWHIDSNGNYVLDFSDTTGMNYETAVQYKNKYDSVQLILVGMNDTHVRLALANSDIDFVIPWHSSGNSKDVLASLIGSVGEHLDASVDYTKFQTDMVKGSSIKYKDENGKTIEYTAKGKQTAEEKARWDARVKLLTREELTLDERKIIYSDKYLKGLYDRFYGTNADGTPIDPDCYGVKLPKAQANQIFPYEYWVTDPSLPGGTKETADVNGQRFVEYCESMGLVPRFSQFKDDPGYWKLLIDRKMYDNNGNYRRQQAIDVTKAQIGTLQNGHLTNSQLPLETSAKYGSRYSEQEQQAVDNTLAAILPQYDVQGDFSVTDGLTDADIDQWLADMDSDEMAETFGLDVGSDAETRTVLNNAVEDIKAEFNPTIYNGELYVKQDTLDHWLSPSGYASTNPNYAQAYIAKMNPQDFLRMTTATEEGQQRILNEAAPLDESSLQQTGRDNPIRLYIDEETGKIVGHEGRHRCVALARAGVTNVPVLLFDSTTKYTKQAKDSMTLEGQDPAFDDSVMNGNSITLENVVPLATGNREQIINDYTASEEDIRSAEENGQHALEYSIGGDITDADIDQMLVENGLITQEQAETGRSNIPATTGNITIPPNTPDAYTEPGTGPVRQRQFGSQTAQRSDALHDDVKQYLREHSAYNADSNQEQIDRSIEWVRSHASEQDTDGYYAAMDEILDPNFNSMSADGQARMLTVMSMAALKGDVASETRIADAYNQQGTRLGQAMQARKIFNLMTPLGRISMLKKTVNNLNQRYIDQGKSTRVNLSDETLRKAGEARTAEEFREVQKQAYKELAEQMPSDWKEKLRSMRYFSMLFNPVTHIRNVLGNAGFMPAIAFKNTIGTGLEHLYQGKIERSGDMRTKALVASKENRAFAKADAITMKDELTGEAKFNQADPVQQERKMFGKSIFGKAFQGLIDFNSNLLEAEDWAFLRRHYANALSGWMQANNVTPAQMKSDSTLMDQARAYAIQEAQKATYRDASKFASMMSDISRKGGPAGFLVDAALPFKKTPTNILKRGIEYSPIGLLKTVLVDSHKLHLYNQWVKNGSEGNMPSKAISPTQYIDRIASGLSGTGIAAMGALMSAMGWLKVGLDDDDEIAKQNGEQEYALKVSLFGQDVSYTIDWLAPSSMPLFVGASIYNELMKERKEGDELEVASGVIDSVLMITEPVFNLSMLDGVNSLFQTNNWRTDAGNNLTDIGATVATNYVTSFVPTLAGKVARTMDTTRRETYVTPGTGLTRATIERTWQKILAKVPGATNLLKPYVSPFGEEEKASTVAAVLQNFVSPGYFKTVEISDMEKEMQRLYEATGEKTVVPKQPAKYFQVDGEKLNLNAEQYTTLQKTRGTLAKDLLNQVVNSPEYQIYGDAVRVEMIDDAWKYCTEMAKKEVDPNFKLTSWVAGAGDNPLQALIDRREEAAKAGYITQHKAGLLKALDEEDMDTVQASIEGLKKCGKDEKYVKGFVSDHYRPLYIEAVQNNDMDTAMDIQMTLMQMNIGYTKKNFDDWIKNAKKKEEEE